MNDSVVGARYSGALYEIAEKKGLVIETYDELNMVMESYEKNKEFKEFIDHPLVEDQAKKDFINKIFGKEFNKQTIDILEYLIDKSRLSSIRSIVTEYLKIYYKKSAVIEAVATFAVAPTKEQEKTLVERLNKKTGKEIKLSVKVDPSILGGIIVKLDDEIIDGSIKTELEKFKNNY